ncbi:hypothetical protein PR048_030932 [Dryococelus australis]|uniref:Uncharacterized protein n=1 Tax=Dryococelus australis TaxID=614101 RepID=A0ABQ9GB04_9NEOP|nr:hypothetical protein PR048_030932 [Dryococelus australis]
MYRDLQNCVLVLRLSLDYTLFDTPCATLDQWETNDDKVWSNTGYLLYGTAANEQTSEARVYTRLSSLTNRGRGGVVVRLLVSHLGEPVSITGGSLRDFRMWQSCRTMPLVGEFSQGSLITHTIARTSAPWRLTRQLHALTPPNATECSEDEVVLTQAAPNPVTGGWLVGNVINLPPLQLPLTPSATPKISEQDVFFQHKMKIHQLILYTETLPIRVISWHQARLHSPLHTLSEVTCSLSAATDRTHSPVSPGHTE